jgi:hypothetical protein
MKALISPSAFWESAYLVAPSDNSLILLRVLRGEMLFLG